jgi:hypothetical protein
MTAADVVNRANKPFWVNCCVISSQSVKILDTFIQFKANVVFFLDNNLQKKGAVGKFANGNLPLLLPKRTVINH